MNKKTTGLLLSILGVISLVLITAGVTYAFFSYAKEGQTVNQISTGTITFYYDEVDGQGKGINITDALPMDDDIGKNLEGTGNVFNFKVTSTITGDANISYTVTARKDKNSTLDDKQVKLYLVATGSETGTNYTVDSDEKVKTFYDLTPTNVKVPTGTVEKTIFAGTVPARSFKSESEDSTYTENFILRMWLKGASEEGVADYSPYEFVLKSAATGKTGALKADDLIADGKSFITSTTYYGLTEGQENYERVAYVNQASREIYTVSQTVTTLPEGFVASEQFYPLNGQTFKVTINVYADATVVTDNNG